MHSVLTVALVRSAHRQWNTLHDALTSLSTMHIVGDVYPTHPLCILAGCCPAALLVDADVVERPPVPLVRDLHALCPDSKIILLGTTARVDGTALITLHDQGIRGYLVWENLRPETVQQALLLVVENEALVSSPIVLATFREEIERRREVQVEELAPKPEQRRAWTRSATELPASLTPRQREVAELLSDGYTNAEIGQQLYIGEETVHKHVQTILHKFDLPSRRAFGRTYRHCREE